MDALYLQQYIEEHLPVVARNGLVITDCTDHLVTVEGNYLDHINHVQTVFGGSISMALTVAAWAHVRSMMDELADQVAIVVRRQFVEFDRPVKADFRAVTSKHADEEIETFLQKFEQTGKARLTVHAVLYAGDEACARFEGQFVVLRKAGHPAFGGGFEQ